MRLIALVGMCGSGKSVLTDILLQRDFKKIRFGDLTMEELKRKGLVVNEQNERIVREAIRKKHGMAAYAKLNIPKIRELNKESDVVIDGLYSWEEYQVLKEEFGKKLVVICVYASPKTRYIRLHDRNVRPLTETEAANRDKAEIENINKGGPIAMADHTIINETDLDTLKGQATQLLDDLD